MRDLVRELRELDDEMYMCIGHIAAEAADRIAALEEALKPFASCVFNDNGDVTLDTSHLSARDYLCARAILQARGEI